MNLEYKLRVHEFDKGYGFATATDDTIKEKIEEQLGKASKAEIDPTNRLTKKIQKKLCKLRKESDPIPPRLNGTNQSA